MGYCKLCWCNFIVLVVNLSYTFSFCDLSFVNSSFAGLFKKMWYYFFYINFILVLLGLLLLLLSLLLFFYVERCLWNWSFFICSCSCELLHVGMHSAHLDFVISRLTLMTSLLLLVLYCDVSTLVVGDLTMEWIRAPPNPMVPPGGFLFWRVHFFFKEGWMTIVIRLK